MGQGWLVFETTKRCTVAGYTSWVSGLGENTIHALLCTCPSLPLVNYIVPPALPFFVFIFTMFAASASESLINYKLGTTKHKHLNSRILYFQEQVVTLLLGSYKANILEDLFSVSTC